MKSWQQKDLLLIPEIGSEKEFIHSKVTVLKYKERFFYFYILILNTTPNTPFGV